MTNRPKTERNQKIMEYWTVKKWRQISIARLFKMTPSAVGMVIWRETKKINSVDNQ